MSGAHPGDRIVSNCLLFENKKFSNFQKVLSSFITRIFDKCERTHHRTRLCSEREKEQSCLAEIGGLLGIEKSGPVCGMSTASF